jgi:hypothetical protein
VGIGDDKLAQARADERDGNWSQAATNYLNIVGNSSLAIQRNLYGTPLEGVMPSRFQCTKAVSIPWGQLWL